MVCVRAGAVWRARNRNSCSELAAARGTCCSETADADSQSIGSASPATVYWLCRRKWPDSTNPHTFSCKFLHLPSSQHVLTIDCVNDRLYFVPFFFGADPEIPNSDDMLTKLVVYTDARHWTGRIAQQSTVLLCHPQAGTAHQHNVLLWWACTHRHGLLALC